MLRHWIVLFILALAPLLALSKSEYVSRRCLRLALSQLGDSSGAILTSNADILTRAEALTRLIVSPRERKVAIRFWNLLARKSYTSFEALAKDLDVSDYLPEIRSMVTELKNHRKRIEEFSGRVKSASRNIVSPVDGSNLGRSQSNIDLHLRTIDNDVRIFENLLKRKKISYPELVDSLQRYSHSTLDVLRDPVTDQGHILTGKSYYLFSVAQDEVPSIIGNMDLGLVLPSSRSLSIEEMNLAHAAGVFHIGIGPIEGLYKFDGVERDLTSLMRHDFAHVLQYLFKNTTDDNLIRYPNVILDRLFLQGRFYREKVPGVIEPIEREILNAWWFWKWHENKYLRGLPDEERRAHLFQFDMEGDSEIQYLIGYSRGYTHTEVGKRIQEMPTRAKISEVVHRILGAPHF